VAELVEASGPFDRLRDLGYRGVGEVAELVEAPGPFDRLRDLGYRGSGGG